MIHATVHVTAGLLAVISCIFAGVVSALHVWHPGWWPADDHCSCVYMRVTARLGVNGTAELYYLPQVAYPDGVCWDRPQKETRCTTGISHCPLNLSSSAERDARAQPERLVATYDELQEEMLFDTGGFTLVALCLFMVLCMHLRNAAFRLEAAHASLLPVSVGHPPICQTDTTAVTKDSPSVLGVGDPTDKSTDAGHPPKVPGGCLRARFTCAEPELVVPLVATEKPFLKRIYQTPGADAIDEAARMCFETGAEPWNLSEGVSLGDGVPVYGTNLNTNPVSRGHISNRLLCSGACGALHAVVMFVTAACLFVTYSTHRFRSCDTFTHTFVYWHTGVMGAGTLVALYYLSHLFHLCVRGHTRQPSEETFGFCNSCCSRLVSKVICAIMTVGAIVGTGCFLYYYFLAPRFT